MKTKKDIQLELLQELDDICSKNNIKYILAGLNSLNAYLNHTLKNGPISIAIAMPQGDIDRLNKIIREEYSENRYLEGKFNNKKYDKPYAVYGNKNTTDYNIINPGNNIHHGININIYPIRRKNNVGLIKKGFNKVLNKTSRILRGRIKNSIYIDNWKDIQNYPRVRIINRNYETEIFREVKKYEIDGIETFLPKDADSYFTIMYGEDYKSKKIRAKKQGERVIIDTNKGYEKVIAEMKDLIEEARKNNAEIQFERSKCEDEMNTVKRVWQLVQMTKKQVEFIHFYKDSDTISDLSSLNFDREEDLEKANEELKPIISALRKYSKKGMTFSIDPKTDKLIEKFLLKKNKDLLNEINELKQKKYFIE